MKPRLFYPLEYAVYFNIGFMSFDEPHVISIDNKKLLSLVHKNKTYNKQKISTVPVIE